jgi:Putative zinc finger motif, C2HC5-type
MSKTAWSRASSVPSDRIPPSRTPTPGRNKGKGKADQPPKSQEVLTLEGLVEGLKSWTTGKDPKGGCFCLGEPSTLILFKSQVNFPSAQEHAPSKYTPLCVQCGLVLCSLHKPFYPCPHCSSVLISPAFREELIQRITAEISEVLVHEAEQREHERRELQKAAGAFPTLAASSGDPQLAKAAPQSRKVLSLNPQSRKVTVTSYMAAPPAREPSAVEAKEDAEIRVPPPKAVDYARGKSKEGRRWQNLRDGNMTYIPLPAQSKAQGPQSSRRKKKGTDS